MKRMVPWLAWAALGCSTPLDGLEPDLPSPVADEAPPGRILPPLDLADPLPPPISGGTLAVQPDGTFAVVSDPDRGRVTLLDLDAPPDAAIRGRFPTALEPGRAAFGHDGGAWVVLRRGGLGRIEPDGTWVSRPAPCPSPRGIAVGDDALYLTCLGGAGFRLDPETLEPIERHRLATDLRDVVAVGDRWWISRFRTAEILVVERDGRLVDRFAPPMRVTAEGAWSARVAWRLRLLPDGRVGLLHQLHAEHEPGAAAYGRRIDACDTGRVQPALTIFGRDGRVESSHAVAGLALAVDFAVSDARVAFAAPGEASAADPFAGENRPDRLAARPHRFAALPDDAEGCLFPFASGEGALRPIGVAADPRRGFVLHDRREGRVVAVERGWRTGVAVGTDPSIFDSGHDLFHVDAGGGIGCVGCHPEGGDDGHTWRIDGVLRRTPVLYGGLTPTAPLHWDGSLPDMRAAVSEIVHGRMGGLPVDAAHGDALGRWLDHVPAPPVGRWSADEAVERGALLFADLGCSDCHAGLLRTDNRTHDLGRGPVQTPALRALTLRSDLMHDGCASGLGAGLADCGGAPHRIIAELPEAELADLIAFLASL